MMLDLVQEQESSPFDVLPLWVYKANRPGVVGKMRGRNMWGHKNLLDQLTSLWGAGGRPRVSMLFGTGGHFM